MIVEHQEIMYLLRGRADDRDSLRLFQTRAQINDLLRRIPLIEFKIDLARDRCVWRLEIRAKAIVLEGRRQEEGLHIRIEIEQNVIDSGIGRSADKDTNWLMLLVRFQNGSENNGSCCPALPGPWRSPDQLQLPV